MPARVQSIRVPFTQPPGVGQGAAEQELDLGVGAAQFVGRPPGQGVVELDEERKAAMVSNLLVVLCSEQGTQPVVNTGTLYQ